MLAVAGAILLHSTAAAQQTNPSHKAYFPPAGKSEHRTPASKMGLNPSKLTEAIKWAEAHGSKWDFEKDQRRVSENTARSAANETCRN